MRKYTRCWPVAGLILFLIYGPGSAGSLRDEGALGIFDSHSDVGTVLHPGTVEFDPTARTYTVAGSGQNMWAKNDAFQFVWKKMSGDLSLTADISFIGDSTQPHRKACLIIRQSVDADSPYIDIALHGDGLTSLQFRPTKGDETQEIRAKIASPKRLRIEKRGNDVRMYLAEKTEELQFTGAVQRISFDGPFCVGLAVCSHDQNKLEKAVFSNVELISH